MELNIVADYLQKYFRDLDHQITEILTNIETVTELIEGGIEQLNLNTKQDQLEVLLGFMFRI